LRHSVWAARAQYSNLVHQSWQTRSMFNAWRGYRAQRLLQINLKELEYAPADGGRSKSWKAHIWSGTNMKAPSSPRRASASNGRPECSRPPTPRRPRSTPGQSNSSARSSSPLHSKKDPACGGGGVLFRASFGGTGGLLSLSAIIPRNRLRSQCESAHLKKDPRRGGGRGRTREWHV
jgi:hypothetical protein